MPKKVPHVVPLDAKQSYLIPEDPGVFNCAGQAHDKRKPTRGFPTLKYKCIYRSGRCVRDLNFFNLHLGRC